MGMIKQAVFYVILLLSSTALGFQSEVNDAYPFGLFFDDQTPVQVTDGRAQVDFLFQIPEKHYLYREILKVELDDADITQVLVKPGGVKKFDEFMGKETEVFYHQLALLAKWQFPSGYDYSQQVTGRIIYQGCSDRICFRAVKQDFSFSLKAPSAKTIQSTVSKKSKAEQSSFLDYLKSNDFSDILGQGIWFALLLTFLAGVLTSVTPCVLPVIPLTLAFIGVRPGEKKSIKLAHLSIFVLGLTVMYATLGVVSASLGQTLGFFYQSQAFLVFLILFFLVMAAWMFGLLNLNVPSSMQSAIAKYQPQGWWRYFYSGLTVGFLAAPCVGPVLGPLLVYIASTQDLFLGFVLMLSYALGLSLLFVLLGFVSNAWIGRFSSKSNLVKKFFGFLLVLVAGYYLWILLGASPAVQGGFFQKDFKKAEIQAKRQGKGVLVDFYADWCLPCHEWDKTVWNQKSVQKAVLKKYIPVKIDCTEETLACEEAVDRFKVIGWPTVVILNQKGEEVPDKRLVGQVLSAQEFIKHIE